VGKPLFHAGLHLDDRAGVWGAGVALSKTQHPLIIAYQLGAKGALPDTVGS
jgi:hypothetical protein